MNGREHGPEASRIPPHIDAASASEGTVTVRARRAALASWQSAEEVRVPSARQAWECLTFAHFPYAPSVITPLLPESWSPDIFNGRAWVGVTPFRLPASVLPSASGPRSTHVEVNVRTYVREPEGRDGLWFLSLELDQPAIVAGLRSAAGLPYRWSRTWLEEEGREVHYSAERRRPHRDGSVEIQVEVGERMPTPPGASETFLAGRWRAFTERAGRIVTLPVQHPSWPLTRAELRRWHSDAFLEQLGLLEPDDDPHVLVCPGVEVKLGLPRTR